MSTSSFGDGVKSAWSALTQSAYERLCEVLPFVVHAAQNSAAFTIDRFISLIRLNISDYTFSRILVSGYFAAHRRTAILALVIDFWLILAV